MHQETDAMDQILLEELFTQLLNNFLPYMELEGLLFCSHEPPKGLLS
jgi:hypothetical protein